MFVDNLRRTIRCAMARTYLTTTHTLRAFRDRTDGVAAVEFALLLPIMALMIIGAVEMSQAVTIDRRTSQAASSTGDLVARADGGITEDELLDINKIGMWLMKPYDGTKIKIKLSYVTMTPCPNSNGCSTDPSPSDSNIKTKWKCDFDGASPGAVSCTCPNTSYAMPSVGLIKYNDATVVADIEYSYTPLVFDYFMKAAYPSAGGVYKLTEKLHLKPRGNKADLLNNDKTVKCAT